MSQKGPVHEPLHLGDRWEDVSSLILSPLDESKASALGRVSSPSNGFFFAISCNPIFVGGICRRISYSLSLWCRKGGGNVTTAPDKLKLARSKASMCNFREKIEWEVRHSKIVEHASAQQSDNTTLYLYAQPHWVGSGGRVVDRNFSSWRVVEGRDVVEDVGQ